VNLRPQNFLLGLLSDTMFPNILRWILYCLLLIVALQAHGQNALINPGFETSEEWDLSQGIRQNEVVKSGQFAVKFSSEQPGWAGLVSKTIYLPKSVHEIKITGWMKVENVVAGDESKGGAMMGLGYFDEFYFQLEEPPNLSEAQSNSDWKLYSRNYKPPKEVSQIQFFAGLTNCKGTVYFDDLSIEFFDQKGNTLPKGEKPIFTKTYKTVYSKQELHADIDQLVKHLRLHPTLHEFISEEELGRLVEAQKSKITDSMPMHDFYRIAQTIVAGVGCVHTSLNQIKPDSIGENSFRFPLRAFHFQDSLYVMERSEQYKAMLAGSQILQINGVPISEIRRNIWGCISADGYNSSFRKRKIDDYFIGWYHMLYGVDNKYKVQYLVPLHTEPQEIILDVAELNSSEENSKPAKNDSPLLFSINEKLKTAIITVTSFSFYNNRFPEFKDFVDDCFKQISDQEVENIIIDLRDNGGGDPYCSVYLLRYLSGKSFNYYSKEYSWFSNRVEPISSELNSLSAKPYILINGAESSTTGHFCALVKHHDLGIFVGSESGATYTCNDYARKFRLSNTALVLRVAQETYSVDVDNMPKNRGISPHYMVSPNKEEFFSGKDVVMDFVLGLISDGTKQ